MNDSVFKILLFKVRAFFLSRRMVSNGFLSFWCRIPVKNLPVGLITGRVFDRQVYTRLTLTVGACYIVMEVSEDYYVIVIVLDLGTHQFPLLLLLLSTSFSFHSLIYVIMIKPNPFRREGGQNTRLDLPSRSPIYASYNSDTKHESSS